MNKKIKKILWIVYFCVYILLAVVAVADTFSSTSKNLFDYIDLAISIPSIIAVFGWIWKRKMLNKTLWVTYATTFLAYDVLYNLFLASSGHKAQLDTIIGLILALPAYVATVLYAVNLKNLKV